VALLCGLLCRFGVESDLLRFKSKKNGENIRRFLLQAQRLTA
jgi:hypothetical protein